MDILSLIGIIIEIMGLIAALIAFAVVVFLINKHFSGGMYTIPKEMDLSGKYAIVTGGNSGIGYETAMAMLKLGCHVIIAARDQTKGQQCVKQMIKLTGKNTVEFMQLDLADLKSIDNFVDNVGFPVVDYLVNNAGLMGFKQRKLTRQGFQMQYGVNHLGHFYLTCKLWPKILKSSFFRVINVSSLAHLRVGGFFKQTSLDFDNINYEKGYDMLESYARSKLYNTLFTRALAQRIPAGSGLTVSLHPGVVRTDLPRYMFQGVLHYVYLLITPIYAVFTKSSYEGAQTTIYTLLDDNVENGAYFADCRRQAENKRVLHENWDALWRVSEEALNIKFNP